MFLIDTDILSALRKPRRHPGVAQWLTAQRATDLFLSVVSIGEVERGIEQQHHLNRTFSEDLALWLDQLLRLYATQILDIDISTARRWGKLSAAIGNDSADLMIAATALEHGLTVVTRNTKHFKATGAAVLDPFH